MSVASGRSIRSRPPDLRLASRTVESTIGILYSQLLATDPIALAVPRARQPVTV